MRLVEYGLVPFDLDEIISKVSSLPSDAWQFRNDPESHKTKVVRDTYRNFPRDEVERVLSVAVSEHFKPGYTNRTVLSLVPGGEEILAHTDDLGEIAQSQSLHCHIPLVTDEKIIMGFPGYNEEVHLKKGFLYALDVRVEHYVKNPSDIGRLHLLFGYWPHDGKLN